MQRASPTMITRCGRPAGREEEPGEREHQRRADEPGEEERDAEEAAVPDPVVAHPAEILVADLREDRVHHQSRPAAIGRQTVPTRSLSRPSFRLGTACRARGRQPSQARSRAAASGRAPRAGAPRPQARTSASSPIGRASTRVAISSRLAHASSLGAAVSRRSAPTSAWRRRVARGRRRRRSRGPRLAVVRRPLVQHLELLRASMPSGSSSTSWPGGGLPGGAAKSGARRGAPSAFAAGERAFTRRARSGRGDADATDTVGLPADRRLSDASTRAGSCGEPAGVQSLAS